MSQYQNLLILSNKPTMQFIVIFKKKKIQILKQCCWCLFNTNWVLNFAVCGRNKKSGVVVYLTDNKQTLPDYNRHLLTRGNQIASTCLTSWWKLQFPHSGNRKILLDRSLILAPFDCLCNLNGFGRFNFIFLGSVQILLLTGKVVTAAQTRRCFLWRWSLGENACWVWLQYLKWPQGKTICFL